MGRPPKSIKPVPFNLSLDGDIAVRLKAELFSPLEDRVPHGAQSSLINAVLRKYFRSQDAKRRYQQTQTVAESPIMTEQAQSSLDELMGKAPAEFEGEENA